MNWFILAVLSALFWGIENFLHKISAKKKLNSSQVSTVFGITACLLGLIFFFIVKEKLINVQYLLFISLMNAILFFSSFITRLEALKKIDASIYFPVSKTGTLFIMIFLSLFFLKETITNLQIVGLIMTTISIYLLTWTNKKDNKSRFYLDLGLILILASTILGAFANLTLDFASNKVGTYAFTFVAYALGFIFSYFISKLGLEKNDSNSSGKNWNSQVILMGVAIGFFNLFGLVFFIEALKSGAFSIVGAINNFSLLLTIGLSVLIYKERPTTKQILGIVLAFISLFLFRA